MLSRRALRGTPVISSDKDLHLPKAMRDLAGVDSGYQCLSQLQVKRVEESRLDINEIL